MPADEAGVPGDPACDLACVVMSLRSQSSVVAAVQSVLAQATPIEIVVVNSGGGPVVAQLRDAGIEVPVIDHRLPLLPGAARNAGIQATRARYVAFLAADCLAAPGWAAGRLREHRAGAVAVAGVLLNAYPANVSARAFDLLLHYRMGRHALAGARLFYGLSYDRRLFERFGTFRVDLPAGEDTEFNTRFAGLLPVVFAPDVRTAHRNPTAPGDLLHDVFRRGLRRARTNAQLGGGRPGLRVAIETLRGVPWGLRLAWADASWAERRMLLRAAVLVPPAAFAYAAGALAHDVMRRSSPPSPELAR